jgi:hypothetical protein
MAKSRAGDEQSKAELTASVNEREDFGSAIRIPKNFLCGDSQTQVQPTRKLAEARSPTGVT